MTSVSTPPISPLRVRLVVIAKAPVPGQAKTRMAPALGLEGAARLAEALLADALARVTRLQAMADAAAKAVAAAEVEAGNHAPPVPMLSVELCLSPSPSDPVWQAHLPSNGHWHLADQGSGDLGNRMGCASQRASAAGEAVVLVGTDCPLLSPELMWQAIAALTHHEAALVPAADGGYVLLGLRLHHDEVFVDMPWSTDAVAGLTLSRLAAKGCKVWLGPTLPDVDEPPDLVALPAHLRQRFGHALSQ